MSWWPDLILVSLSLVIVLFIFTSAMCLVESDGWQDTFLYVTVASVVVININAAIFQSKKLEIASRDLLLTFAKFEKKKWNNNSTNFHHFTAYAKQHEVKHRKNWKLLNWESSIRFSKPVWMGISSWEVHKREGSDKSNDIRNGKIESNVCPNTLGQT